MRQRDRDRRLRLQKARRELITQKQAAAEMAVSERQTRRLPRRLKERGDKAVAHTRLDRRSNRRLAEKIKEKAIQILGQDDMGRRAPFAFLAAMSVVVSQGTANIAGSRGRHT
jgi:hypothetical protein